MNELRELIGAQQSVVEFEAAVSELGAAGIDRLALAPTMKTALRSTEGNGIIPEEMYIIAFATSDIDCRRTVQ